MTKPYWPAMMLRKTAAAYCELSEAALDREVSDGRLPPPIILGGKLHWHRAKIDAALERLAGTGDWRAKTKLYGNAA